MINYNTERIVIAYYPPGAGGKFLVNSLGLSAGAIFQSIALADQQLAGNFSPSDKLALLRERIASEGENWDDLGLGCAQLFGVNGRSPVDEPIPEANKQTLIQTIDASLRFFIVAHTEKELVTWLTRWPRATVIKFYNCENFLKRRTRYRVCDLVPWPSTDIIWYGDLLSWNTNLYFSKTNTLKAIKQLYTHLGLVDFNRNAVAEYYSLWITRISQYR